MDDLTNSSTAQPNQKKPQIETEVLKTLPQWYNILWLSDIVILLLICFYNISLS